MSEIFATKLGRSFTCVISFDLSTTLNKSVPKHAVKKHFLKKKKKLQHIVLSRIRQHVDNVAKIGEYFFPRHFKGGFQRSIRTISKGFPICVSTFLRVSKRFKVPGIASNILRNKSALAMGICFQTPRPRKRGFLHETEFSLPERYHFDGRSYVLPNRKNLNFDYLKSRQMR